MKIQANAKLNLCLDITGIRDDGYHLLDMVMQEINIFDEITIEKADSVIFECDDVIPEGNTLIRGAEAFFDFTGINSGVRMKLDKHIPVQSGLGGGSSDGAAVIKALNDLYETDLSSAQMQKIALNVGSDAPFFIGGGTSRVAGVGEDIASIINNIDCVYLLVKPDGGVSTKQAYAHFSDSVVVHPDIMSVVDALRDGDIQLFAESTGNLLTLPAKQMNPDVEKCLALFIDADYAMMTGSGSCVFGMYENREHAALAAERIKKEQFVSYCTIAEAVNR